MTLSIHKSNAAPAVKLEASLEKYSTAATVSPRAHPSLQYHSLLEALINSPSKRSFEQKTALTKLNCRLS